MSQCLKSRLGLFWQYLDSATLKVRKFQKEIVVILIFKTKKLPQFLPKRGGAERSREEQRGAKRSRDEPRGAEMSRDRASRASRL